MDGEASVREALRLIHDAYDTDVSPAPTSYTRMSQMQHDTARQTCNHEEHRECVIPRLISVHLLICGSRTGPTTLQPPGSHGGAKLTLTRSVRLARRLRLTLEEQKRGGMQLSPGALNTLHELQLAHRSGEALPMHVTVGTGHHHHHHHQQHHRHGLDDQCALNPSPGTALTVHDSSGRRQTIAPDYPRLEFSWCLTAHQVTNGDAHISMCMHLQTMLCRWCATAAHRVPHCDTDGSSHGPTGIHVRS